MLRDKNGIRETTYIDSLSKLNQSQSPLATFLYNYKNQASHYEDETQTLGFKFL